MRTLIGRLFLFVLAIALSTAACAQSGSQPLLWKATSATNVVFLYGTIHVGSKAFYPLHPDVESAFERSKVIALEADPTNPVDLASALARAGYRPPDRIDNHISSRLAADLRKLLPSMGLSMESVRQMKPYLLSMALSMRELSRMGYDAQWGLDIHFAQRTQREGKRLLELESMTQQLGLFDAMPADMQEVMLRSTLDTIRSGAMEIDLKDLIQAWKSGDDVRLLEVMNRDTRDLPREVRDEMEKTFYKLRNEAMAQKIAHILDTTNNAHFVAVGAGHLPGQSGIVELLRQMGYAVSRVRSPD